MKRITAVLLLFLFVPALYAQQQTVVNLTTAALGGPYNVPFDQLAGKFRVTILSNSDERSVYLTMLVRGDNGIVIQSNGNQQDNFNIQAGVPVMVPDLDNSLDILFMQQNLSFTGVDPQTVYDYGLPPAHYQVCFQLWTPNGVSGPAPLTLAAPSGCSDLTVAQGNLNIGTIVMPPYTADFLQYSDKVRVTLFSTQYTNLQLKLTLKGNNGITIATSPDYVPPQFTELQPNATVVLTGQDLWDYFNGNNLVFSGILKQEVADRGLPAGTYRLCFRAYDQNGRPLSGDDPAGCSSPFTLQEYEPPSLLLPNCGDTIAQTTGQPLLFTWSPSPGAPPQTPYTLKLVEMNDPEASPGDALQTATTPAFFETTVLGTSYLYGPADPVLEKGKKYAYEVIAGGESVSIRGLSDFNASALRFKNKGKSAPCFFVYGKPEMINFFPVTVTSNNNKPKINEIRPDPEILPHSTVTGQLNYKFKPATGGNSSSGNTRSGSSNTSGSGGSGSAIQGFQHGASMGSYGVSASSSTGSQLASNLGYIDPSGSKPLAGVRVSLVVRYVMKSGSINSENASGEVISKGDFGQTTTQDYNKMFKDDGTVLKTTYTDQNGKFRFDFVDTDTTMGQLKNLSIGQGGEFSDNASGQIYKTIRLIVGNKYYCSPDVDILLKPWENEDLGILVSWVKSYNLQLSVISTTSTFYDQTSGGGTGLNDVEVKVLRGSRIPGVPYNEGNVKNRMMHVGGTKYEIEEDRTLQDGKVLFTNLVMHDPDNNQDRYYLDCSTSSTTGLLNYKSVERRYNPLYLKDKKNFPFNSQGKEQVSSGGSGGIDVGPQYETYGKDIAFNHEFEVNTYQFTVQMYPKHPRIYGQAKASGFKDMVHLNNVMQDTTMKGVNVLLLSKYKKAADIPSSENSIGGNQTIRTTFTDADGYYSFNNLPLESKIETVKENNKTSLKANVTGPVRRVVAKPKGFGLLEKQAGILKYGDQVEEDFSFLTDGIVAGYVEDQDGNPVPADIKIEGYPALETGKANLITALALLKAKVGGLNQVPAGAQMFAFLAPSGNNRKVTVIPHDLSLYLPVSEKINIPKMEGNNPKVVQEIVVKKLEHRVKFRVMGYNQPPQRGRLRTIQLPDPLKGVKVKVTNLLDEVSGSTDDQGYVTLEFMSADTSFTMDVIPDEKSEYSVEHVNFSNLPSGDVKFAKTFFLFPGFKISGRVSIGDQNDPVDSAKVYLENNADIYTYTDKSGKYTLDKVPGTLQTASVEAEKSEPGKTIIGDKKENIALPVSSEVDLHLKVANQIPDKLFGFPVSIDSVDEQGSTAIISGSLKDVDQIKNQNFNLKLSPTDRIRFSNVKLIKKQGSDILQPESNALTLDADKLPLEINGAFLGDLLPASGSLLKIEAGSGGKGLIRGRVNLSSSTFKFNSGLFSFGKGGAWLAEQGTTGNTITVFRSPPEGSEARKFMLTDGSGKDPQVTLKGFAGTAGRDQSYLSKDTLSLALTLSTQQIQGLNPSVIKIDFGDLKLTNSGFVPVNSSKSLSFNLEKWDVVSQNWSMSQQSKGIEIASGTLKTGVVNLPVKDLVLTPTSFKINQIELDQITMAGVMPLTLNSKDLSFGYFPSVGSDHKGHWRLAVVGLNGKTAASLTGLPGLAAGENIRFQVFSMLSNGEQSIDLADQDETLTFYHILKVNPLAIVPYDGYFQLLGSMDMNIPRIEKQNGKIRFSRNGSSVDFTLYPLNMGFDAPGKVRFIASQKFGDQVFKNSTFSAPGVLNDEEGLQLKAVLHRDLQHAWVEVDPYNQKLPVASDNSIYLSDVRGEMRVDNSKKDWGYFTFNGIMTGAKGMEGDKKKTFTIYGDIVADNQSVKVSNISTGFGNINITYDFKHARMIGNMDIDADFASMGIKGVANMLVGSDGWYFLAGANITAPGIGNFQAGLMIGDYDHMTSDLTSQVMQYAYNKNLPKAFQGRISGMFITGRKSIPVINVPDVGIDLWILSARLGIEAGMDARFWMSFDGSGNEYGIGAMAFAHAYFIASSITCTTLAADARAELGAQGSYNTGTGVFTLGGCGSFSIGVKIQQCFPTLVAGCEGCIGKSLDESIKVNLLLDSQGHTDLSFGFGNCSGQPALSSGD